MNRNLVGLAGSMLVMSTLLLAQVGLRADEPKEKPGAAAAKKGEKKEAAKPKGQLPPHFTGVVTEEQREKIYAMQAECKAKIEALEKQIESLKAEHEVSAEKLLTAEQLAQVKKKRDEAKAVSKIKADAKKEAAKKGAATGEEKKDAPEKK